MQGSSACSINQRVWRMRKVTATETRAASASVAQQVHYLREVKNMNCSGIIRHKQYLVLVLLCFWFLPSNGSPLSARQSAASQGAGTKPSAQAGSDTKSNSQADSYHGSIRRSPSGLSLATILALATILNPQPSIAQKAASLPAINSRHADSPAERFVLKSVHDGIEADLTKTKDRRLKAEFLETLLFRTSASAVPNRLISISGAIVEGRFSTSSSSARVKSSAPFLRALWLVCASKVYSGLGADIVMASFHSLTRPRPVSVSKRVIAR